METIHDILMTMSRLTEGDWSKIYGMLKNKRPVSPEEIKQTYAGLDCKAVCFTDKDYPDRFKEVYNPPFCLFYKGDFDCLTGGRILGVVGSRTASEANLSLCEKLVQDTISADSDIIICSGMARGIDSKAMRTAMAAGRRIIAVLGSGISNPYPEESRDIYDYCASGKGVVISEYPGAVSPIASHFPFRNRLIAALSSALLVVECRKRSGTSTTVRQALDLGKDILVVPQPVSDSDGSNMLIRDGASVCLEAKDILCAFE